MIAESGDDGIRDVSYAGLQRQERPRDSPGLHLGHQEFGDVSTDRLRALIRLFEALHFVALVVVHDAGDLLGRNHADRGTDAVRAAVNRNLAAMRWIGGLV